jgi:hypothetical protein
VKKESEIPKKQVIVPDDFRRGLFGVDIILSSDDWEAGKLHLFFQPRLVGNITTGYDLERPTSLMDMFAESFKKDGEALGDDTWGKEMDKALSEVSSKGKSLIKGDEVNVTGLIGVFRGNDYKKGVLGSIENPVAVIIPTKYSQDVTFIPAETIHIDWAVINGSDIVLNDILVSQIAQRFYNERIQNSSERRIITL